MLRNKTLLALLLAVLVASLSSCSFFEKSLYPINYEEYIEKYAAECELPPELLAAVIMTESSFDPKAKSPVGATGLMQLLPSTCEEMCERMKLEYSEELLTDPEASIKIGAYYLRYLYNNTGKNWETACAAYNAGIGNVKKWQADPQYSTDGVTLIKIPAAETENYIERINKYQAKYKELYFKGDK